MDLSRHHALVAARPPSGPSLLLATGITAAMLLAAFGAGLRAPRAWWDRGVPPSEERVTYVAPTVATPLPMPAPPRALPGAPTAPAGAVGRPAAPTTAPSTTAPRIGPAILPGAAAPDTGVGRRRGPGAAAGTPAGAGEAVGPALGPLRVGAETPGAPPLTREQKDSVVRGVMRDIFSPSVRAAAVSAAADAGARRDDQARRELTRSASGGAATYHGLGVSIAIGGGKSKKEREREAAIDADVRARLAAVAERARQQRADSARRDSIRAARGALKP